jgi:hypothetical protein
MGVKSRLNDKTLGWREGKGETSTHAVYKSERRLFVGEVHVKRNDNIMLEYV